MIRDKYNLSVTKELGKDWQPELAQDFLVLLAAQGSTFAPHFLSIPEEQLQPYHIGMALWANVIAMDWGIYMMGSPKDEEGRWSNEYQQLVVIYPFALMQYPVTEGLWQAVMENKLATNLYPKTRVSWHNSQEFCSRINELTW